jgi:hypothetical protein
MIDPAEVFQVSQVEMLPVNAEMIRGETQTRVESSEQQSIGTIL